MNFPDIFDPVLRHPSGKTFEEYLCSWGKNLEKVAQNTVFLQNADSSQNAGGAQNSKRVSVADTDQVVEPAEFTETSKIADSFQTAEDAQNAKFYKNRGVKNVELEDAGSESSSFPGTVGISGAGLMGCSIAAAFLRSGIPVLVYDLSETSLATFAFRVTAELTLQLSANRDLDSFRANFSAKKQNFCRINIFDNGQECGDFCLKNEVCEKNEESKENKKNENNSVNEKNHWRKKDGVCEVNGKNVAKGADEINDENIVNEVFGEKRLANQPDAWEKIAARLVQSGLRLTHELRQIAQCQIILETIPEKLRLKQKHYQKLNEWVEQTPLLLSNTSTIEISRLAQFLESSDGTTASLRADRFCGFHFFHPVRKRSLVEIIRGNQTSDATLVQAMALAQRIEKTPILVQDGPGFLVNRLLNSWLNESMTMLLEGIELDRIEAVCQRFGMEMGPFRIMDEIGLEVALHAGWTIFKAFPQNVSDSNLLPTLLEEKRLGRKNGRGFYRYCQTETSWLDSGTVDPELTPLLKSLRDKYRRSHAEFFAHSSPFWGPSLTDEMIAARFLVLILLEAGRILEDRIVDSFEKIDQAWVLGLGFPKAKGGICFWADAFGLEHLWTLARNFEPLGRRYAIPEIFCCSQNSQKNLVGGEI